MSRDELKAQLAAKREELRRVEEAFSEAAFRRQELLREIRNLETRLFALEHGGNPHADRS
jgi:septal ring factor EnvC (AmiA/AmiB activator)